MELQGCPIGLLQTGPSLEGRTLGKGYPPVPRGSSSKSRKERCERSLLRMERRLCQPLDPVCQVPSGT